MAFLKLRAAAARLQAALPRQMLAKQGRWQSALGPTPVHLAAWQAQKKPKKREVQAQEQGVPARRPAMQRSWGLLER